MEFFSAAAPPPSPPRMALCRNPAGVRRRRWLTQKMGQLKLAAAAPASNAPVVVPPLRRSERRVADSSAGARIPSSPRQQAKQQLPLRRQPCPRIQSRGSNRKQSSPPHLKRKNAPYYWGARRARSALAGAGGGSSGGSSSPIIIQSRGGGGKRKFLCYSSPVRWGAKRARSAICCGEDANKPAADPVPAHVDWANLGGDGPAGVVAERVLANDVAGYVRFRAVCRLWRRRTADPRAAGLDGRFFPRRWIMLDKAITAGPRCHRFLNISTGECIRMSLLPELDEHRFLAVTPEGLLLLLQESNLVVRLLNPLTRQLTDLPPVTGLLKRDDWQAWRLGFRGCLRVDGVGISVDASMVAVSFFCPTVLAVAKPGGEGWTIVGKGHTITSTATFAGRFYCTTYRGIMMLDAISGADRPPRMLVTAKWGRRRSSIHYNPMAHTLHLVDNGQELMLVHRMVRPIMDPDNSYKYEVYRVDLNAGNLVRVKSLNGHAVFMGMCRAISVSAEAFPSVTRDTLYLGTDCDEKSGMDGYNIADGSYQPRHDDWWMHPRTLVECLSSCIRTSEQWQAACL